MSEYSSCIFKDSKIELDGNTFIKCKFDGCTLIYNGGRVPGFVDCELTRSGFAFADAAGNTMTFLRFMYHGGFKSVVDEAFKEIQTAPPRSERGEENV